MLPLHRYNRDTRQLEINESFLQRFPDTFDLSLSQSDLATANSKIKTKVTANKEAREAVRQEINQGVEQTGQLSNQDIQGVVYG